MVYLHLTFTFQSGAQLESSRTSTMRLFPKLAIAHRRSEEKLSITGLIQENFRITLPPNSLELHKKPKPKDEILDWIEWNRLLVSLFWNCASVLKSHTHDLVGHQPLIEQKPTTTDLTIYKYSTSTKLDHLTRNSCKGKSSQTLGVTKGNLGLTSPPHHSLGQHKNNKGWMARCSLHTPGF